MDDSDSSSEPRDRLNDELPDLLILVILSLLPMRDVVMTAFLSKRWKYLWTKVPCMHFQNPSKSNLDKFRNFVCWALQLWNGTKIQRFSISSDILDSWLHFAIEKQVEELHLNLDSQRDYYAPRRLYSCSWIRELTLISCKLKIEQNVQWNQLKSLTIDGTQFCIKIPIDQILHGAPNLEFLSLVIRDCHEHLNIRSRCLKVLKIFRWFCPMYSIGNHSELVIWAPNLEAIEISQVMYAMFLLNVPSLTNVLLDFEDLDDYIIRDSGYILPEETLRPLFCSISHAENVTLTDGCIKVLLEMKKKYRTPISFSNAKFLKLDATAADEVIGVIEIFAKLMMLIVEQNFKSEHLYTFNDEKSGNNLILMLQILHPRLPLLRPHQQLHTVINLTFNLEVQRPLLIKFVMEEVLAKTKRNTRNIMFHGIYVIGMATILHYE
ncbi:hypothetical protein C2S51_026512 [Perilla frutescens var. frutescens]|nr:hypothetical protein C2S51_026512 [Perilla frutescens var. frutescens]